MKRRAGIGALASVVAGLIAIGASSQRDAVSLGSLRNGLECDVMQTAVHDPIYEWWKLPTVPRSAASAAIKTWVNEHPFSPTPVMEVVQEDSAGALVNGSIGGRTVVVMRLLHHDGRYTVEHSSACDDAIINQD